MTDDDSRKPTASLELILYLLDELKRSVDAGFLHTDKRLDRLDERVGHLETWRAEEEMRTRLTTREVMDIRDPNHETGEVSGPEWVKITLGLVALIGAALTIIAQNGS